MSIVIFLILIIVRILSIGSFVLGWRYWNSLQIIIEHFIGIILIWFAHFRMRWFFVERVNIFKSLLYLLFLFHLILFLLNGLFGLIKSLLILWILHRINLLLEFGSFFCLLILYFLFVHLKFCYLLLHFNQLHLVFFLLLDKLLLLFVVRLLLLEFLRYFLLLNELFFHLVHFLFKKLFLFFLRNSQFFKLCSKFLVHNFLSLFQSFLFIELILVLLLFLINLFFQRVSDFFTLIYLSLENSLVHFHDLDILLEITVIFD